MLTLRDAHYSAFCTMIQDMRDYRDHGEWFREAMLPILPISAWRAFVMNPTTTTPLQWTQVEYNRHEEDEVETSPDLRSYRADGLMPYTTAVLPLDIMRGRRVTALKEWLLPYQRALRNVPEYFSLERLLESDCYTVTFFVEREAWFDQLFAKAIGRGK